MDFNKLTRGNQWVTWQVNPLGKEPGSVECIDCRAFDVRVLLTRWLNSNWVTLNEPNSPDAAPAEHSEPVKKKRGWPKGKPRKKMIPDMDKAVHEADNK